MFCASGSGEIFILNSIPSEPELIISLQTDQKVCIRGLTRSINTSEYWLSRNYTAIKGGLTANYLMVSDINGYITIFDIANPGKEKQAKRIGNTQGKEK